jgi:hypothetical protein
MKLLQSNHTYNHIHNVNVCFRREHFARCRACASGKHTFRGVCTRQRCNVEWKVAFAELRALTNRKSVTESGLGLNPMELNSVYEYLRNMGVLLKTDGCLDILEPEFRPWPKVHEGDTVSDNFYRRLKKNKAADIVELNSFNRRADVTRYTEVLKKQLGLFGAGILTSLKRTMGNYLKVTFYSTSPCRSQNSDPHPKPLRN